MKKYKILITSKDIKLFEEFIYKENRSEAEKYASDKCDELVIDSDLQGAGWNVEEVESDLIVEAMNDTAKIVTIAFEKWERDILSDMIETYQQYLICDYEDATGEKPDAEQKFIDKLIKLIK